MFTSISRNFIVEKPCITEAATVEVFYKKDVLKNFAKFTGNYLCQSLLFNKVDKLTPF